MADRCRRFKKKLDPRQDTAVEYRFDHRTGTCDGLVPVAKAQPTG
jgi:hypothetical protein